MDTLALSPRSLDGAGWDLVVDASGNLKINTGGLALAQDVASAVSTFKGECWYDSALGVPYIPQVLGRRISLQFLKQMIITAGMIVPQVSAIVCYLTGPDRNRMVGGQLQVYSNGQLVSVVQTGNISGTAQWWVSAASRGAVGAVT